MADQQKEISALEFALRTERDGHQFYTDIAATTTNPIVAATFSSLAKDEVFHIRAIEAFSQRLRDAGQWEDTQLVARVSDQTGEIMTLFREAIEGRDIRPEAVESDTGAYRRAAEFERESQAFYAEQADAAEGDARTFWQFLADEEKRHLRLIEGTLNYLDRPEDWHLFGERGLLDGG
jgi:hypothetical protein